MTTKTETKSLPALQRAMQMEVRALPVDGDGQKTYEMVISSEFPVSRSDWYGEDWVEVLEHTTDAIDLSRAVGMPLLLEHDRSVQIGVMDSLSIGTDGKFRGIGRFSRSPLGAEIEQDVADGIRRNISVGYRVLECVREKVTDGAPDVYRVTRWQPMEVSIVSIPADPTVGVGRSASGETFAVAVRSTEPEIENLSAAAEQPQPQPENEVNAMTTPAAATTATVTDRSNDAVEIVRMANLHGHSDKAADFLQRGLSPDQAARELLNLTRSAPLATSASDGRIDGLSAKDASSYSYTRSVLLAMGEVKGGIEQELHQELARSLPQGYQSRGGIMVPMQVRAALDSKTAGAGKDTVFTQAGELIDLLRDQAVVTKMGARIFSGLNGPVQFPKITGGAQAHWVSENPGTDVDESNMTTGSVTLSPKTLQATTAFSRQLLATSSLAVESAVRGDIASAHALALDRAALHGTGLSNQPTGIYSAADVGFVNFDGTINYGAFIDMIAAVFGENALNGSLGFVCTPQMAAKLAQTLIAQAAGSGFIWNGRLDAGSIAGYKALASNQLAKNLGVNSDEHGIVFGNFNDLLIGMWGSMEIVVDPYALKKQGLIEVTSFQMADVALRHGESFCKAKGAKLA